MTLPATQARLAARYGTPLYVYQLADVRAAAARLRAALPAGAGLCYSLKANSEPDVVAAAAAGGLAAEISSVGELAAVLAANVPADQCLYTGPGKTDVEVRHALANGVRQFSVESTGDYRRLVRCAEELATTASCLVRINPPRGAAGSGLRMTGKPSPFGVDFDDLAVIAAAADERVPIVGTHVFSATNVTSAAELVAELDLNAATTAHARRIIGPRHRVADLGGGFAAPFARAGEPVDYPGLRTKLTAVLDERLDGWRQGRPRVVFESGRAVSGPAGTLLLTVTDVKCSRGTTQVVLDGGINVLGGMSGLGRLLPNRIEALPLDAGATTEPAPMAMVGPLCTPLDVLAPRADGRVPVAGSVLAVPNVGAYGLHASLIGFLGRTMPGIVVLDGQRVVRATRWQLRSTELVDHEEEGAR